MYAAGEWIKTSIMMKKPKAKQRAKGPPPFRELVTVAIPFDKSARCSLHLDLTEEEFSAIGFVVGHWALLEHELFFRTLGLAQRKKISPPKAVWDTSFSKRLNAFRDVVRACVKSKSLRIKLLKLADRIGSAEGRRHRVVHDFWTYNPKRIEQLWSMNARRPYARMEPINCEKLLSFGQQFADLAFELRYTKNIDLSYIVRKGILLPPRTSVLKLRKKAVEPRS